MEYFVDKGSVVREIWGKSDTILLIFAGAAAEFALNKAVDWLYFTGQLPSDPLKRLFSTVTYARQIVFSEKQSAFATIDRITLIHSSVEASRGQKIPDWAYRDVLFMLIHYSIASFELMERKFTSAEKNEVYNVFLRLGKRLNVKELPRNFDEWLVARGQHLQKDLAKTHYTVDLFRQYKKHLGWLRYQILREAQILVLPQKVNELLQNRKTSWLTPLVAIYKLSRKIRLDRLFKAAILPAGYKAEIKTLDIA